MLVLDTFVPLHLLLYMVSRGLNSSCQACLATQVLYALSPRLNFDLIFRKVTQLYKPPTFM